MNLFVTCSDLIGQIPFIPHAIRSLLTSESGALTSAACLRCGSSDFTTSEREFANGTKHIEQRCVNGHFQKFLPQNKPIFAMPFGKHKGEAIKDLPGDYLNWILENVELKNNIRRHLEAEFERRGTVEP